MNNLSVKIPKILACGYQSIKKSIMAEDESIPGYFKLLLDGTGLENALATPGVNFRKSCSNNIQEIRRVLGVEAAKKSIMNELETTMGGHGIQIDTRHLMLISDLMAFRVISQYKFNKSLLSENLLLTYLVAKRPLNGQNLYHSQIF